jgi:hypothetical protein
MEQMPKRYDPRVIAAMRVSAGPKGIKPQSPLSLLELKEEMILSQDVITKGGRLLISKGQCLNELMLNRLRNFAQGEGIKEPIIVERDKAA